MPKKDSRSATPLPSTATTQAGLARPKSRGSCPTWWKSATKAAPTRQASTSHCQDTTAKMHQVPRSAHPHATPHQQSPQRSYRNTTITLGSAAPQRTPLTKIPRTIYPSTTHRAVNTTSKTTPMTRTSLPRHLTKQKLSLSRSKQHTARTHTRAHSSQEQRDLSIESETANYATSNRKPPQSSSITLTTSCPPTPSNTPHIPTRPSTARHFPRQRIHEPSLIAVPKHPKHPTNPDHHAQSPALFNYPLAT